MTTARDHSWDALVDVTQAQPHLERGALNKALKVIRDAAQTEGLKEEDIPLEIRRRAAAYRRTYPQMAMTPIALAKHWFRVITPNERKHECPVCHLRFKGPRALEDHLRVVHYDDAPTADATSWHPF